MNLVLFGPPGAGKGTQAGYLKARLGVPHISSGDTFREIRRQDTPLGQEIRDFMDRGLFIPDELTIQVIMDRLNEPDIRNGFILDGFPRTETQAHALDRALAPAGRVVDAAIFITVPVEVVLARLSRRMTCMDCHAVYHQLSKPSRDGTTCDECHGALERRSDEAPDVILTRLDMYARQTEPLASYYRERGCLIEVDGSQEEQVVAHQLADALARVERHDVSSPA